MKLDDLRTKKPSMPEDMKAMVEQKVKEQLLKDGIETDERLVKDMAGNKIYLKMTKAAAVVLAAGLVTATTVVAGVQIAKMKANKIGKYAQEITIDTEGNTGETVNIPDVEMQLSYLPKGLFKNRKEHRIQYEDNNSGSGTMIHYFLYRMDEGDKEFHALDTKVLAEEEIQLENTNGVYLEVQTGFDKKVYLTFPEVHYAVELWASPEITKEELLKVAEGIQLVPTDDADKMEVTENWSDVKFRLVQNYILAEGESSDEEMEEQARSIVTNPYEIGESIKLTEDEQEYYVTVTDVQVYEGLSVIPEEKRGEKLSAQADAEGKLLPGTVSYIKSGDYIDTLDEVIATEEVDRKLVYVTMKFENSGATDIDDLLVFGNLQIVTGDSDDAQFLDIVKEKNHAGTYLSRDTYKAGGEMCWWNFSYPADGNGDNYIEKLAAGETEEVNIAFLVDEDQLPYMYLVLASDNDFVQAVIDIRQ